MRKKIDPSIEDTLYSPGFGAQKHSCDFVARVRQERILDALTHVYLPGVSERGMGVQRDVGETRVSPHPFGPSAARSLLAERRNSIKVYRNLNCHLRHRKLA